MSEKRTPARLTQQFLQKVKHTGLTDAGAAAAIGVSRQFYSQVKNGDKHPTTAFMVGAVRAGLARNFAEVAEPIIHDKEGAAA